MSGISLEIVNSRQMSVEDWEELVSEVLDRLIALTPVDTGNCADGWVESHGDDWASFENDVEYASFLEDGWSSQAPNGMIKPTIRWLRDRVLSYDLGEPRTR